MYSAKRSSTFFRIYIQIGHNPITANMTSVLLTKIHQAKESNLVELDLAVCNSILVFYITKKIMKRVQEPIYHEEQYVHIICVNSEVTWSITIILLVDRNVHLCNQSSVS